MNHQLTKQLFIKSSSSSFKIKSYSNLNHHHHNLLSSSSSIYHQAQSNQIKSNSFSTNQSTTTTTQTTPYHIGKSGKQYSPWLVKLVIGLGKGLGYNLPKSHAITITSDLYDHCSNQFHIEKSFWINQCGLPDSFQTWFQVTQLHLWIIITRFRSMRSPHGKRYVQELVNHAFIDTEHRIRSEPLKVTKNSLVKGYMKTLLDQHYGFLIGFDWALACEEHHSDLVLVEAVWRNLFGAMWGRGMGGVKGIFKTEKLDQLVDGNGDGKESQGRKLEFDDDVMFVENLESILGFVRRELVRVATVSDEEIMGYQTDGGKLNRNKLVEFGKIC